MKEERKFKMSYVFLIAFSVVLMFIGTVYKLQKYPNGFEMQLAGLISTVIFIAAMILKSKLRNGSLFYTIAAVTIIGGIVFKIMHLPGMSILLLIGCISALIWFLIDIVFKKKKK